jgi:protein-S-isoprenylcysteine O-methyltransferase Ste14
MPRKDRMSKLELRAPPDLVWLVVAAVMWLASATTPGLAVSPALRLVVAAAFIAAGVALIAGARVVLDRTGTTWHPSEPERSTHLVRDGVFRVGRNPTYLGMLLVLVGWAVVLGSPTALALSAIFALWMDRFQIRPEERVLSTLFGQDYRDYASQVRRWL